MLSLEATGRNTPNATHIEPACVTERFSRQRSQEQRLRGERRREWLQYITQAGGLAGVNIEPVYRAAFHVLRKVRAHAR